MPMSEKNISERLQTFVIDKLLTFWDRDPERRFNTILNLLMKINRNNDSFLKQARIVQKALTDRDNNWYRFAKSFWTDIDDGVRRKLFHNLIINALLIGEKRQEKAREKNGCNIPWAILFDPTSACNLHCLGCWAADYGHQLQMDFETMDDLVRQGKELGVYFYVLSGGEPLVRKRDVIDLCGRHNDCVFLAFTNGIGIDEAFAGEMLRVRNFVPAISIEGFAEETDLRRGAGSHEAAMAAMAILKANKLPFGVSCCYTRQNTEVLASEAFFDDAIRRGAKFAWFFTYIPVGANALPELMATAEQRELMYRRIRAFRETKPIFTIDFWNDGEYEKGCIAGGRRYLHINANGDVEPCAFIHYSDSNIHDKTLLAALKSPFFMQYRENQPFNANHLLPCPLLDNPGRLAEMVERSGARSTNLQNPEDVRVLTARCRQAAEDWAPVAERLWREARG